MGSDALVRRATGLLEAGQAEAAAEMARTALATEEDPGRTIRLMSVLADALTELGDAPGALNVLAHAGATVGPGRGGTAAEIARRYARAHLLGRRRLRGAVSAGGLTEAATWAERLASMGAPGGDPAWQVEGDLYQALAYAMAGQPSRAKTHALRCSRTAPGVPRAAPDLVALLAVAWWLAGEPAEAALAVERLGSDRTDERAMHAVGRFETGDVLGAVREASVGWDGITVPRSVEALGGLLTWGSADPARSAAGARVIAEAHRAGLAISLPHLTISLAARALLRAGQRAAAVSLAEEVTSAVAGGWPRGAATIAYEVLEDAESLSRVEPGSVASLRHDRLVAARRMDIEAILATRRRFQSTGLRFEAAETLAIAGRMAFVRGEDLRGTRLLQDAERAYTEMGATVEAERARADAIRMGGRG